MRTLRNLAAVATVVTTTAISFTTVSAATLPESIVADGHFGGIISRQGVDASKIHEESATPWGMLPIGTTFGFKARLNDQLASSAPIVGRPGPGPGSGGRARREGNPAVGNPGNDKPVGNATEQPGKGGFGTDGVRGKGGDRGRSPTD